MAEYLQLVGTAITAADVLISAAQRIQRAGDTLWEIEDGARHLRVFLHVTRRLLARLEERYRHIIPASDFDYLVNLIKSDVESCQNALQNSFHLRDNSGRLESEVTISERLKIAVKDGKIKQDRKTLERLEQRLHRSFWMVQTELGQLMDQRETKQGATQESDFHQSLIKLDETAKGHEEWILDWQSGIEYERSIGDQNFERAVLSALRGSSAKPNESKRKREDWPSSTASSSSLFREGWLSRGNSSMLKFDSAKDFDNFDLSVSSNDTSLLDERQRNEAREAGVETLDALKETFSLAWREAGRLIGDNHWNQAAAALSEAIECAERAETLYKVPFKNRFQVHEDLALVYVNLSKFSEALKEIPLLLWQSTANSSHDLSVEETLLKSRSYQLCALIHFLRYLKNDQSTEGRQMHTPEGEQDLEEAKESALAAFKILEDFGTSVSEQPDGRQQLAQCLRILVGIYEALEDPYRAEFYWQRLEMNPPSFYRPFHRRYTDQGSLIETTFDLEHRERPNSLTTVSTGGTSDASDHVFACVANSDKPALMRLVSPNNVSTDFDIKDDEGRPLLNYAVTAGDAEIVHFLLEHDADANCTDDKQETPLLICVKEGHRGIAEDLIAHRANATAVHQDGWTLLHHAIRDQSPDMTTYLLTIAPELRDTRDASGKTPLHHCAEKGGEKHMLGQAEILLRNGADVNARIGPSANGRTPLQLVVKQTCIPQLERMVELLLKYHPQADPKTLPSRWKDYECLVRYCSTR